MERGERIKVLRVGKGWKQPDLVVAVRALGSFESSSYLSKIETGQAGAVSADTFEAIANALELPKDAILTDRYDDELQRDPIAFLRRHSLEKTVTKHEVSKEEADALRGVERAVQSGPITVSGWEVLRAYGLAYGEVLRKPGARAESRRAIEQARTAAQQPARPAKQQKP